MAPSTPPSIGDMLMLSQTAWKISRTFAQRRTDAPAEFAEVGADASELSDALKVVAESLHEDDSMLTFADDETKAAVNSVLESAQKTLADLESCIERYQTIRKKQTKHGFSVERTWSDIVLASCNTFKWTVDGGSLADLRELLQMHTDSIRLSLHALQTRAPLRLQRPADASNRGSINSAEDEPGVLGEMEMQGDELTQLMTSLTPNDFALLSDSDNHAPAGRQPCAADETAVTTSHADARSDPPGMPSSTRASWDTATQHCRPTEGATGRHGDSSSLHPAPLRPAPARDTKVSANASTSAGHAGRRRDADSAYFSIRSVRSSKNGRHMDWSFETGSPPDSRDTIGEHLDAGNSPCDSAYVASESTSPRRESCVPRRESTTLPNLLSPVAFAHDSNSNTVAPPATIAEYPDQYPTPPTSLLPPPALAADHGDEAPPPATPSSIFRPQRPVSSNNATLSAPPEDHRRVPSRPRTATATSTPRATPRNSLRQPPSSPPGPTPSLNRSAFERQLFRNAVILCDVRARLVEHAQVKPDEPDPRYNIEMVPSCATEARVLVIRKRENREHTGTKIATSIWVLSTDQSVRMQHKLSEVAETIPYCSSFDPEKVSLQSVDMQIALRFHAPVWGDMLLAEHRTGWVNYMLASEGDAIAFQSAVFGRMLLGSFRTSKTTVIHAGLKGAFAFEEQFANIEMLRLWEDDGLLLPGAQGGVMALMHVSSNFGEGWARWWINNAAHPVKIKEDGARHVKIKGIDLTVVRPGVGASKADGFSSLPPPASPGLEIPDPLPPPLSPSFAPSFAVNTSPGLAPSALPPNPFQGSASAAAQRRNPYKRVTGVRIEFKTDDERNAFVTTARAAQARALPLPDL